MSNLLNNSSVLVILTVLITLAIVASITVVVPLVKNKGVNIPTALNNVENGLETAGTLLKTADAILPNNPAINILKIVDSIAKTGVSGAEQLYVASQLAADQRNAKAKEIVNAALKVANIETTPELEKVIDGTIEAEVLALGHAPADIKKLQDAITQQTTQTAQLQAENTALKQTITTIQSSVQAATATTVKPTE